MSDQQNVSSFSQPETYRIRLRDCGCVYARILRDVDGFTLKDDNGELINVYSKSMRDMLVTGRLRAIRSIRHGYLYFVTNDLQRRQFQEDRQNGSPTFTTYYVYMDKEE